MKTAGVIGGLGPETTSEFYLELIFGAYRKDKTIRPGIIISSVSLPYKIEEDLILRSEGAERYIPYLTTEAKRLEKAGADFIVMPCNSFIKTSFMKALSLKMISSMLLQMSWHKHEWVNLF